MARLTRETEKRDCEYSSSYRDYNWRHFWSNGSNEGYSGTNYPLVVVTSESMLPGIEIGDLLIVKGMAPEDIEVGDHEIQNGSIIIYETEGIWPNPISQPVVHRVVGQIYNSTEDRYYFYCPDPGR